MKIEIKPVSDINKWYRFWSLRFSALGMIIMGFLAAWPDSIEMIWKAMPDEMKVFIPGNILPIVSFAIFTLAAFSRLVRQNIPNDKTEG